MGAGGGPGIAEMLSAAIALAAPIWALYNFVHLQTYRSVSDMDGSQADPRPKEQRERERHCETVRIKLGDTAEFMDGTQSDCWFQAH